MTFRFAFAALVLAIVYAALSPIGTIKYGPGVSFDGQRVLLVTAHPDDECMFFGPTVLALRAKNVDVHSICLSVGNQDGLGQIRRGELERSLDILGISADKRQVVDKPDLPDNITLRWEPTLIADVVRPYALKHSIDVLLTFDTHGISGHPNHGSLPLGLARLLNTLPSPKPRLYTLTSVPLAPKYIGPLAPLSRRVWLPLERLRTRIHHERPHVLVVISGIREYLTAHRAMRAHQSQLVWFRHLYVLFSRYMWVNEWTEFVEKPVEAV